jgi:hypothetical protein
MDSNDLLATLHECYAMTAFDLVETDVTIQRYASNTSQREILMHAGVPLSLKKCISSWKLSGFPT